MKRKQFPTLSERDTSLAFWVEDPKDVHIVMVRNALVAHLRSRGFRVTLDQRVKRHYRCLSKSHHEGRKGDLRFKLDLSGRHLELTFYQELVRSNPNGGVHDFDKRQKMPYLIGKQYELERLHIAALFAELGYTLQLDRRLSGMAFIQHKRRELEDFQGAGFYAKEWYAYNTTSGGKRTLRDGDRVYFLDYMTNRIATGYAYRNINNMWWVLLPDGEVRNIGSHALFHRDDLRYPLRGRIFSDGEQERRLRDLLKRSVTSEAFERAAVLRNVIRRRFPDRQWLITKDGAYYRPDRCGYTTDVVQAGRYTEDEAKKEAALQPDRMKAIHESARMLARSA